ncbi:glycosyltransferase [Leptolyngbya ohadii]|uniref:glycosyltransferase n=1 Tax=Leptolyngbya ohadii TaxID=1962290 RepID=UPI000B59BA91|nr:glycosyltransferase [Leptolyngbya ohadii]
MKILFLSSRFPYPPIQGDRLRAYHFLRLLAAHHQITLVSPIETAMEYAGLSLVQSFCKSVELIPASSRSRILNLIQAPFRSLPWQVTYCLDDRIQQRVDQILAEQEFDIVHVQLARMAPFLQKHRTLPKLLDFIDALSLNMARRAKQERGIAAWFFTAEAKRMQAYEQRLIHNFDQLTVCAEIDRAAIGDFPNLDVVSNGVDLDRFSFVSIPRQSNSIIFAGNMRYFPNINAVQYFIDRVLPLIRDVIPDVQLTIVGPNLPLALRQQFSQPGIILTGFVPDVHDYLKRAAVAIAPMQSGSGIQNKVLEAMATGTPVVATCYGMGSLPVQPGKHLFVADDTETFAQAVIRLLQDPVLHRQISIHARQLVEQQFSWQQSLNRLEMAYQKAIDQSKTNPNRHPDRYPIVS